MSMDFNYLCHFNAEENANAYLSSFNIIQYIEG